MGIYFLNDRLWFPPVEEALPDGLVAVGGDLKMERLILAYKSGIFPWFNEDELPMWWCPDPRFVLFPEKLRVSKSLQQLLNKNAFEFRVNHSFEKVIRSCQTVLRKGQEGTWITEEIVKAYKKLHESGLAHSAEAWLGDELVGGLYGIRMGKVFFGESMFSKINNASKYAFVRYVKQLKEEGVALIDCQVYTQHLESLGACMIPREEFLQMLKQLIL